MPEMWQALATGLGTNTSSYSAQGQAIILWEIVDKSRWKYDARLARMPSSICLSAVKAIKAEGDEVDSDYVFLCGVMWRGYGQEEAGQELLRATLSRDPDISTVAWAKFAKGKLLSGESEGEHRVVKTWSRLFYGRFREAGYIRLTTDPRRPRAQHARLSLTRCRCPTLSKIIHCRNRSEDVAN